ncbi:MAG: IgG-binding virulence factor TspB family protein [Eikenella sp.]|nr:IgG-binding virulence factor TspB family protein [Eikenella sp.]
MLSIRWFFLLKSTIISIFLFPSLALAEVGTLVIDNKTGRITNTGKYNSAGIRTIKSISGGYIHEVDPSRDMTRLRDTMRGIRSAPTRLPATVSRTASLAKVAQNIHGKLRYARFTPQALVGSLILGEILQQLIDNGYTYDESTGTMVQDGRTVICMVSYGNCVDYVKNTVLENKYAVYDRVLGNPTQQQLERLCNTVTLENINNSYPLAISNIKYERGECMVTAVLTKRVDHLQAGQVMGFRFRTQILPARSGTLTEAEFQRILEPIAAQNPEAVLQAADLSDSDWSAPKVHVLPGTIVNSQSFTDPKDGKAKQARWEFYDCEDGQSCVRETLIDRPDLQPNSPAAPAPDNPPASGTDTAPGSGNSTGNNTGSGNQSGNEGEQDKDDLCRKYPHIMACDEQPEAGDYDLRIPQETVNLEFRPDNVFATNGQCPAPVQWQFNFMGISKTFGFSLQYVCDIGSRLRPILIAFAFLVAGFFCIRVVVRDV